MTNFLDYSLNKVYESKGIMRDIPSTWNGADWPVMTDLIEFWKTELDKSDPEDKKTIKAMLNKTFSLSEGGALGYMNQKTDIDLSKDFIVIDLSNVPEMIKDAMNVLITGIIGQRFRTDTKRATIIAVDEARVFLHNPELARFLMTALTQGRSHSIALWLLTQQATDLVKSNVAEEFQTNIFLKMILGNNMTKDNVKHVADFFGFGEYEKELLLTCTVGEGLFLIGDQVTPIEFRPTELENAIIKHRAIEQATDPQAEPKIDDRLVPLVAEHGFCMDHWVDGDFTMEGYTSYRVANILGSGLRIARIKKDNINSSGLILNQSVDHYATVCQIAGELILRGFQIVKINHMEDVDISFKSGDKTIAFEYERENTKTEKKLIERKSKATGLYDQVMFICSQNNEKLMVNALGADFVVKRGAALEQFISSLSADNS